MRLIDADALFEEIKARYDMLLESEHIDDKARQDELSELMVDIINAPTVDGWISVKDRLPKIGVKCLIVDGKGDIAIGEQIDKEQRIWQWKDSDFYARGGITHWRPLPESPEDE